MVRLSGRLFTKRDRETKTREDPLSSSEVSRANNSGDLLDPEQTCISGNDPFFSQSPSSPLDKAFDSRWSVDADTMISMTQGELDDIDLYTSSDDEDEEKKTVSNGTESTATALESPEPSTTCSKGKKKNKSVDEGANSAKTKKKKSKTGKKMKKKKSAAGAESKVAPKDANEHQSLEDRMRASLVISGVDDAGMCAITEGDGEEEKEPASPILMKKEEPASPILMKDAQKNMTPIERFRASGKRMQFLQRMNQLAVDSKFAQVFNSNTSELVDKGLMSESDKAMVEKLLTDLQQCETQLEEDRNRIEEERQLMHLQQEAVEHLLDTETMKSQELEARIMEFEEALETQVHQQENEELRMKIQMLEAEIERKHDTICTMAATQQEDMKLVSSRGSGQSTYDSSIEDNEEEGDKILLRSMSMSNHSNSGGAKLQGELMQLRSSLNEKNKVIEAQAKELARLKEDLGASEEVHKMRNLEATCEDFRNESKHFRSEVDKLKKQLAQSESSRDQEIKKVEALKNTEKELDESLRRLKVNEFMNRVGKVPSQDKLQDLLDISKHGSEKSKTDDESDATMLDTSVRKPDSETGDAATEGGFDWFGFGFGKGKKNSKELNREDEVAELPHLPSGQVPAEVNERISEQARLSAILDF